MSEISNLKRRRKAATTVVAFRKLFGSSAKSHLDSLHEPDAGEQVEGAEKPFDYSIQGKVKESFEEWIKQYLQKDENLYSFRGRSTRLGFEIMKDDDGDLQGYVFCGGEDFKSRLAEAIRDYRDRYEESNFGLVKSAVNEDEKKALFFWTARMQ